MADERPNILMFFTDHQRHDAMGCAGNPIIKTPAMDSLAAEGARFNHHYVCGVACMPSRASLWTGQYVHQHGIARTDWKTWLRPEVPTIPSLLTDAGYRTVAVGKMHFAPIQMLGGFQERVIIEAKYSDGTDDYRQALRERGLFGQHIGHHTPGFGKAYKAMKSPLPEESYIDGYIGRRGLEAIENIPEPFFLVVSFCGPHDPYDPPEPYAGMYDQAAIPPPNAREGEIESFPKVIRDEALDCGCEHLNFTRMTRSDVARVQAYYYGMVTHIDACVGRILGALDQRRLSDRTLVMHSCDHGDYIGNHGLIFKHGPGCDDETRVPLLMRWPGTIQAGQVNEALTQNIDVMPTLLEAAGVAPPDACAGQCLLPLLKGQADPRTFRESVVTHLEGRGICYRDRHMKYTRFPRDEFDVLYDLDADPRELRNLCYFKDPGWEGRVSEMRARLLDWYQAHPARVPKGTYGGYGGNV